MIARGFGLQILVFVYFHIGATGGGGAGITGFTTGILFSENLLTRLLTETCPWDDEHIICK